MNIKRVILVGQGASGKDYLASALVEAGYRFPLSNTTRPPRQNEIDGVHYHFCTEEEFKYYIENNMMYEYVLYEKVGKNKDENWYYGRTKESFYDGNIMIMTPAGLDQLSEKDREESFIIYLNIDEEIRRERLNKRDDADDTERRLKTDREDFHEFTNYDHIINNPNFISSNIHMMLERNVRLFPDIQNKMV